MHHILFFTLQLDHHGRVVLVLVVFLIVTAGFVPNAASACRADGDRKLGLHGRNEGGRGRHHGLGHARLAHAAPKRLATKKEKRKR